MEEKKNSSQETTETFNEEIVCEDGPEAFDDEYFAYLYDLYEAGLLADL